MVARYPIEERDYLCLVSVNRGPRGWCVRCLKDEVNGFCILANDHTAPGIVSTCEKEVVRSVGHGGNGDNAVKIRGGMAGMMIGKDTETVTAFLHIPQT